MSYAWDLAPDGQRGLAALPLAIQEETLDVLDRLAAEPDVLRRRGTSPDSIFDFVRAEGGATYYVFLTVRPDHAARVLRVKSIGHAVRHSG